MCPTVTPQAVQTPASTTSKRGLGRKAHAALLRVRTGPECPEGLNAVDSNLSSLLVGVETQHASKLGS